MAKSHLLFGRNVLEEALKVKATIREIYAENESARIFAENLLLKSRLRVSIQSQMPKEIREHSHQGIAFRVEHDFYLQKSDFNADDYPIIVCCNHLEDVQNLGSIARAAAAFGCGLIVHEERRSASLSAAAIKASAGLAFHLKFLSVSNLSPFCEKLSSKNYEVAALENRQDSVNIFDWNPLLPVALIVGSEGEGISKPLQKLAGVHLRIPMVSGIDSLNVAQAATIALSWVHSRQG